MPTTNNEPLNPGLYRLHRIFAFAFFGAAALLAFAFILDGWKQHNMNEALSAPLFAVFLVPIGLLHFYAARGVKIGTNGGRTLSRIIGTVWLIGFPIGTALGVYVWIKTSEYRQPSLGDGAPSGVRSKTSELDVG